MRLVLDATVLEQALTGVARAALGLYDTCAAIRPDLEVVAVHRRNLTCSLQGRVGSLRLGSFLPASLWRFLVIPSYVACTRVDVAHFPWNGGAVRLPGSARSVLTLHDVIPLAIPSLYFRTTRHERDYRERVQRELELADLVITDSECSMRDILSRFRLERHPVVIYPANLLPTHSHVSVLAGVLVDGYFAYLGGYERRKGLEGLVKVYRELHETGQIRVPLVLVGEPRSVSNELTEAIRAGESEGAIIEKGYVPDDELAALLRGARALVYPSLYEGFGYPPLEAMAQGCPVITTRVSSMPEICGEAVRYVGADDAAELAAAILEIDRSEQLRQELSRLGRERAAQFTWEASAKKYLGALDDLLWCKAVRRDKPH